MIRRKATTKLLSKVNDSFKAHARGVYVRQDDIHFAASRESGIGHVFIVRRGSCWCGINTGYGTQET
jgi:hypothetical protein